MSTVHDFSALTINGESKSLGDYRGQVLLIVNVASQCGFTPQYAGLEALWQKYHERGLVVLGFPCNQFGGQEPGDEATIANFCSSKFNVSFPLFAKVDVNGETAHPLWQHLKKAAPGVLGSEKIKWNFTKFLVNREGQVVKRYGSITKPEQISADIERLL
ncbi:MAG: glutathione peroxidase [Rugosibacter sp.]|nr:glutathione peroxidase [Rugosibacter sp.]